MAPPAPLVALRGARLSFGGEPLFEALDLFLGRGERACLVGRNGSGKSTLLKVLAGVQALDGGERFLQPGTRVAYLPQDPLFDEQGDVAGHVAGGLAAEESVQSHRVEAVLARLGLEPGSQLARLSGGERRRVALARALVDTPEVLLLDEPTNHLDLPTILWLEEELARFRGALMVISHDRAFLEVVARTTQWLDRGQVLRLDKPYSAFEDWAETRAAEEAEAVHKLARRIKREEKWLQRGVTARRKRNQGRLRRLQQLRERRRTWLKAPGSALLETQTAEGGGDMVIEAENIALAYADPSAPGGQRKLFDDFSTRIRRGERIGVIGPNGAGKTSLVRTLIGELPPDRGRVRLGSNLRILYFDQRRRDLDPERTLWQTLVPDGGDSLMVRGRQRHVVSYLRDFLFDESQVRQPVGTLSGGEKSRLLLARLLAQPGNLIVLDEPTNDLDMDTLDLLEEVLGDYDGTLLLVSHDRDFVDRLVTGLIAVEGDGRVGEYAGGYSDYLRQRDAPRSVAETPAAKRKVPAGDTKVPAGNAKRGDAKAGDATSGDKKPPERAARKLGYKDQYELDRLPARIEALTAEAAALQAKLADPTFFERDAAAFKTTAARLQACGGELASAEERWLELEELRESLRDGAA